MENTLGFVTPRAGVWIEIPMDVIDPNVFEVTPRAGVWIEMDPTPQ